VRVRMISFGSNWWAGRIAGRQPAWFNSAGLIHGSRIDHSWIWVGQVRFNRSSGFHPEFPMRAIGSTFTCDIPKIYGGRTHLLVTQKCPNTEPAEYLVTVTDGIHGQICFDRPGWSSPGVQPISISRKGGRFEAMLLIRPDAWIESELGTWHISGDGRSLRLMEIPAKGAA
jgi:hypothetical protein